MSNPSCPRCGSHRADRRRRKNIFHMLLLPYFGRYPWVCNDCLHRFTYSSRGERKQHRLAGSFPAVFPHIPLSASAEEQARSERHRPRA